MGAQNDWGPPGGPGMMPMMMGGRGAPGGAEGMPGAGANMTMAGGGGRGGQGGPSGGMMGGPGGGGPPGGMGGRGGPGGFGGPGRGGPAWQGRPNARAFGNDRRDLRNSYMASANFSLDNSVWDARTFSVTGANLAKPSYANARGGVMFGGPLQIPRLISASKGILFTFNLEFQRDRTGTVSSPATMPTSLERAGDFSQTRPRFASTTLRPGSPFPATRFPPTD